MRFPKIIKRIKNFHEYFFARFNLTKKKLVMLKMRNGLNYILRAKTVDVFLFTEVALENTYLLESIEFPENATIIDLGAHIGFFSVHASNKAKKIFAFEPVPENFELLKKNIELNKLENKIIPFNLALSDKTGKEKIFLAKNHSGGHSIYGCEKKDTQNEFISQFITSKGFSEKNFVEVNSITLNEVFKKNEINHCDLLKLDIEGAEYNVFYGLPDSCFNKIQRITMECHDIDKQKNNMVSLIDFLKSKGFKVTAKTAILFAER